jgi:hypothetical protein
VRLQVFDTEDAELTEVMHGVVSMQGKRPVFSSVISMISAASVLHFLPLQPQSVWPTGKQKKPPLLAGKLVDGRPAPTMTVGERGLSAATGQLWTSPAMTVERVGPTNRIAVRRCRRS